MITRKLGSGNDQRLQIKTKLVAQTKNTDDTLALDNDLRFTLKENTMYGFDGWILVNAHATPDFRYNWTFPAGTTMFWDYILNAFPALSNTAVTSTLLSTLATNQYTQFRGTVFVGATPGLWGFNWAQNFPSVEDTILMKGSWIRLLELGVN